MDPKDFANRVNSLDDAFKNAPAEPSGRNQLPEPGTYQAVFREVDFFEGKNAPQKLYLKLTYEVVFDQKYRGWPIEFIFDMEPQKVAGGLPATAAEIEQKFSFLKKHLRTLGVPVEGEDFSLAQIGPGAALWDDVIDCTVEIAVVQSKKIDTKTGQPFVNSYLNARTGDALPTDVPGVVEPAVPSGVLTTDGEDLPF